jgi:UDP-N-acetyl-2-amino-2-deoxyglucuronate dehydrogenase
MKFGIIGAGAIGAFHAKAIEAMDGVELIGVADRVEERADAFAQQHGTPSFSSVDAMLACPEIEIVTVATPSGAHYEPAMLAFKKATDAGRFGKLTSASDYIIWFRTLKYYDSAVWRGTWALDGGALS